MKKIHWFILLITTIIVFTFIIPFEIYYFNITSLSFLGAILVLFFSIQTISNFTSLSQLSFMHPDSETNHVRKIPYLIIPAILIFFFFIMIINFKKEYKLKVNGIVTTAIITNGNTVHKNNYQSSTLNIRFIDFNGDTIFTETSISADYNLKMYIGKEIMIVYLQSKPRILKVLTNHYDIKKYVKTKDTNLELNDFNKLLEMPRNDIFSYLNKINFYWTEKVANTTWVNENRQTLIRFEDDGSITYIFVYDLKKTNIINDETYLSLKRKLNELHFYKIGNENKIEIFKNKKYQLKICDKLNSPEIGIITYINLKKI